MPAAGPAAAARRVELQVATATADVTDVNMWHEHVACAIAVRAPGCLLSPGWCGVGDTVHSGVAAARAALSARGPWPRSSPTRCHLICRLPSHPSPSGLVSFQTWEHLYLNCGDCNCCLASAAPCWAVMTLRPAARPAVTDMRCQRTSIGVTEAASGHLSANINGCSNELRVELRFE